jgi:hypothetical protein
MDELWKRWNRVVEQSDEKEGEDEVRVGIENFHKGSLLGRSRREMCHFGDTRFPNVPVLLLAYINFLSYFSTHAPQISSPLSSFITSQHTINMSSDSTSSPVSNDLQLSNTAQHALWSFIAEHAAALPVGSHETIVFEAAVHYMHDEHDIDITIEEVQQVMGSAKVKRRRRRHTEHAAQARAKERTKQQEEWEAKLSECRTRRKQQNYIDTTPRPRPPVSGVARTPSIATSAAISAMNALDRLKTPKEGKTEKQQQSEEMADESEASELHQPFRDITNIISTSDQPSLSPVSPSFSDLSVSSTASSSSSSSVSSPLGPPIPATTVPSSPASTSSSSSSSSSSSASISSPFAQGLMPARGRISAQQQKKEMRIKIGEQSAALVQKEVDRRNKSDLVVEQTSQVMTELLALTPLLRAALQRIAGGVDGKAEK